MKLEVLLVVTALAVYAQAQSPRTPTAVDAGGANLPAQKIGPNDLIAVSVYDAPELTRSIRVDAGGAIHLPLLKDPVQAEGLLPKNLETAIAQALMDGEILVDPIVSVTVVEYYSRPISVAARSARSASRASWATEVARSMPSSSDSRRRSTRPSV